MVFYAGEVIAQGSAKEIREALKDLWKAGKSELKIKLSGLFRNKIFSKYATKFEKKFHLHFDGEFKIKTKSGIEHLEGTGAHNHSVIGKNIQVRKYLTQPDSADLQSVILHSYHPDSADLQSVLFNNKN